MTSGLGLILDPPKVSIIWKSCFKEIIKRNWNCSIHKCLEVLIFRNKDLRKFLFFVPQRSYKDLILNF